MMKNDQRSTKISDTGFYLEYEGYKMAVQGKAESVITVIALVGVIAVAVLAVLALSHSNRSIEDANQGCVRASLNCNR